MKKLEKHAQNYLNSVGRNEIKNLLKNKKTGEYFITIKQLIGFNFYINEKTKFCSETLEPLTEPDQFIGALELDHGKDHAEALRYKNAMTIYQLIDNYKISVLGFVRCEACGIIKNDFETRMDEEGNDFCNDCLNDMKNGK